MTLEEFRIEFDVLYNNIASMGAPGINNYEKSVLLTKAQEDLIREFYSGERGNESFELTERRRRELANVVRHIKVAYDESLTTALLTKAISPYSVFFEIPEDTWFIVQEQLVQDLDGCGNLVNIKITPLQVDKYNVQIDNPFRRPNEKRGWRVDQENYNNNKIVELVLDRNVVPVVYSMRYIRRPNPIILVNFDEDPELSGLNLMVRGINIQSECSLQSLDTEILKRAVQEAVLRYEERSLTNLVNLNK